MFTNCDVRMIVPTVRRLIGYVEISINLHLISTWLAKTNVRKIYARLRKHYPTCRFASFAKHAYRPILNIHF